MESPCYTSLMASLCLYLISLIIVVGYTTIVFLIAQSKKDNSIIGTVTEALPNAFFRVKKSDNEEMLCYLSGKMRLNRIRVLIGDKVEMEMDSYGGKARIIRRN